MFWPFVKQFTVQHYSRTRTVNEINEVVYSFTDPEPRLVYAWADIKSTDLFDSVSGGSRASGGAGERLTNYRDLYTGDDYVAEAGDEVGFPDGRFRVVGYAQDFNHGPWPFAAPRALVFHLVKVSQ